jgi:hypothetical protein
MSHVPADRFRVPVLVRVPVRDLALGQVWVLAPARGRMRDNCKISSIFHQVVQLVPVRFQPVGQAAHPVRLRVVLLEAQRASSCEDQVPRLERYRRANALVPVSASVRESVNVPVSASGRELATAL